MNAIAGTPAAAAGTAANQISVVDLAEEVRDWAGAVAMMVTALGFENDLANAIPAWEVSALRRAADMTSGLADRLTTALARRPEHCAAGAPGQ
jgi:hypothetical protein